MMIFEHSIREDSHRAMRLSHAAVMDPGATPESAKASLKLHGATQDDLRKSPLILELWIDRFPGDPLWLLFLANATAFITEKGCPWDWLHVAEKTIPYRSPERQSAWENDPQTAVWRLYTYPKTSISTLAHLSFSDLSSEVWRADVPLAALYEVADRVLTDKHDAEDGVKPAIAVALYTHGARRYYRDEPIASLIDGEVTDETRAFLHWGWKTHSLSGMPRNKALPKERKLQDNLVRVLRDNATLCLEVLEHTFGDDDDADEDGHLAPLLCLSNTPGSQAKSLPDALRSALPATENATNTAEGLTGSTLELYRLVRQTMRPPPPAMPLPDISHAPVRHGA